MKTIYDPHLLQREFYNPNRFAVIFKRDRKHDRYVLNAEKALGPAEARCEPDGFLYLPHGYYHIFGEGLPAGEPVPMLLNFEKAMFHGNKKASNPFAENA